MTNPVTAFFVFHERIDDRRCAGKYGDLWTEYRGKVRYRLVPGVY
jgi:delta14-sterol reductase